MLKAAPRLRSRKTVATLALLAVLAVAGLIRGTTLTSSLPYTTYVDEHWIVEGSAQQIADRTYDPGYYWNPSLLMNAMTASAGVLSVVGVGGWRDGARVTRASPYIEVVEPPALILAGRIIVYLAAMTTVLLIALLGMRIANRRVGLLAATLAAVLPALVTRSSIVIVDTLAAFFVVAGLYCAARLSNDEARLRTWAALAGVASGLAFVSKYTAVAVILAVFVVIALRRDQARSERLRLALVASAAALVSAVVAMPALVLRFSAVLDDVQSQYESYANRVTPRSYWENLIRGQEVGKLILVVSLVGLVALWRFHRARPVVLGYVAMSVTTAAVLLRSDFQTFRNLLPLLPFLCIAAAATIVELVRPVAQQVAIVKRRQTAIAVVIMACLCLYTLNVGVRPYVRSQLETDSRVKARRWLEARVKPQDDVLVAEELAFLPRELRRIGARVVVRSQLKGIESGRFEYVVAAELPERPFSWAFVLGGRTKLVSIGSVPSSCPRSYAKGSAPKSCSIDGTAVYTWHDNKEQVRIFGPASS